LYGADAGNVFTADCYKYTVELPLPCR